VSRLLLVLMLAGCEGVDLKDQLGFDRPPPTGGEPMYREPRCGTGSSGVSGGGNCNCTSGASGASGGSCNNNPDGGLPDAAPEDVGFPDAGPPCNEHTFDYVNATAQTVWVTGTFTAWGATPAAGALELEKVGADRWSLTTLIEPEGRHEYKFVIDGSNWIRDPGNPDVVPDGFGGENSVIVLCDAACGDLEAFDWRDSVMYFALVDRFFNGDPGNDSPVAGASDGNADVAASGQYEGGDLAGLSQKLPYLADLGVTALWITAPFENRNTAGAAIDPGADSHQYSGYHGYWPSPPNVDYSNPSNPSPRPQVESRIGDESELRTLIDQAHLANSANGDGIKVLFDYVMHHVDDTSGLYQAHNDWFARDNGNFRLCGPDNLWDDPYWGTRCAFTPYLAPFDMDNPAPRAWSVSDALWWAKTFSIDGYRLDAIKHEPLVWLTDLRSRLNAEITNPAGGRFYLVGETFAYDNRELIKNYVNPDTMLDGQFDFPFKARACEAVFTPGGSMQSFSQWMAGNDNFYGSRSIMTTWIGNHDVPRPIHFASRQIGDCRTGSFPGNSWTSDYPQPGDAAPYDRLAIAFAIMMTNPGIPLIYYGDEIGLAGGGDPDNRRNMPWDAGEVNTFQEALRSKVRSLARIRAENPVLGRGTRRTLSADQDTWVYRMSGCGDGSPPVVVAINRGDGPRSLDVGAGPFTDLITGANVAGGSVSVPARGFLVLRE
jgi:glycosidase